MPPNSTRTGTPKRFGSLSLLGGSEIPDQAASQFGPGDLLDPYTYPIGNKLEFQYNPAEIKRACGITWNGQVTPGHSHKRWQWGGGGDNSWKFTLEFFLDSDDQYWVKNRMDWLESILRATYDNNGNVVQGPPHLRFVFGYAINAEVILMPFEYMINLVDPETLLPRYAKAELTVQEISLTAVSGESLRR